MGVKEEQKEGGNLADFDLRSCAFSLIGRLVMRVKRL
jgi:hypothetical protein